MKRLLILFLTAMLTLGSAAGESALQARENWLSPDQYYYRQLSAQHQKAWEFDISNALRYPDQKPSSGRDRRRQALASMIKHDNPRIFWIDWIDSNGRLRYETGSEATLAPLRLPDGKKIIYFQATFQNTIPTVVADIRSSLPKNAGERDVLKAIHDWLCRNNTYNHQQTTKHKAEHDPVSFDFLAAHSAYSAIIPDDAYEPVCEGYAGAFKLLCDEFGIQCICVSGETAFASAHMWNCVRLSDGQWYLVDVTSDDTGAKNNSFHHNYFLIGSQKSAKQSYTPNAYLNSGVNPDNGYTEGAAFTFPTLTR